MSAPEEESQAEKPDQSLTPPKTRLAPPLGIRGQIAFIMSLRLRARMMDGKDADQSWVLLTPVDLERLEDLADGLDKILLDTQVKKRNGGWQRRENDQ